MGIMKPLLIVLAALTVGLVIIVVICALIKNEKPNIKLPPLIFEPPEKRAGRRGEAFAADVIRQVLREDDHLLTNVRISIPEKETELDNVVVNKYGVFIIEVKNYKGELVGNEDDYEWEKYKTTDAGNTYEKTVKNPIRQVKRQIHILAKYLEYYGMDVWVKGYVILLCRNSPVDSELVLGSIADIDRVLHTPDRPRLDKKTVEKIVELLS